MRGYIYIAGAFKSLDPKSIGDVDNDPHFWEMPPTWGICRHDLRAGAQVGDVIFFVLPKASGLPQTIFAYLTIQEIISHADAYARPDLRSKRMGNKKPNGNIIVDDQGKYDKHDEWVHADNVEKIKNRYAIGSQEKSLMLSRDSIDKLAPQFVTRVGNILKRKGNTAADIVSRKGKKLSETQVKAILAWLHQT
jgi:hypothetical protein